MSCKVTGAIAAVQAACISQERPSPPWFGDAGSGRSATANDGGTAPWRSDACPACPACPACVPRPVADLLALVGWSAPDEAMRHHWPPVRIMLIQVGRTRTRARRRWLVPMVTGRVSPNAIRMQSHGQRACRYISSTSSSYAASAASGPECTAAATQWRRWLRMSSRPVARNAS